MDEAEETAANLPVQPHIAHPGKKAEAEFLKNLETWNRFHGVDSNCGINSKLASIPKVGAGLDKGIPCSTLALGWT